MSQYEDRHDDYAVICPYCGHEYEPEGDYEQEGVEDCGSCGKRYRRRDDHVITYVTLPDCTLNGEEHDFDMRICRVCGRGRGGM